MEGFNLLNTLAVLEIGTMISIFVFGISVTQAYLYFSRFPDDRGALKVLVSSVMFMELGHTISVLHAFYTLSILQYGQPEAVFAKAPVGIAVATLLSGYIACMVQVFFADRLRRFSGRRYLTIFCWGLSGMRCLAATGTTAIMLKKSLTDFTKHWGWLVGTCLIIGAVVDIIIAVGLCYDLFQKRSWKDSFTRTTKLIDRIILMTIQTGLLTSLMTLAVTICFMVITNSFIWVGIYICLARVFSNSLLATLNYRKTLRESVNSSSFSFPQSISDDLQRPKAQTINLDNHILIDALTGEGVDSAIDSPITPQK